LPWDPYAWTIDHVRTFIAGLDDTDEESVMAYQKIAEMFDEEKMINGMALSTVNENTLREWGLKGGRLRVIMNSIRELFAGRV